MPMMGPLGPRIANASSGDVQVTIYVIPGEVVRIEECCVLEVESRGGGGRLQLNHDQMLFLYGFLRWQIEGLKR
jgi:hypothetical protein